MLRLARCYAILVRKGKGENAKKGKVCVVVARVNKTGTYRNSRPCSNCIDTMKVMGVKKVYYSVDSDKTEIKYKVEKVNMMEKTYITWGNRVFASGDFVVRS